MPPKKGDNKPSKKTEQKKKDKIVEDKTFGLKNKKGNKQQKFIQQVQKQVHFGNQKTSKQAELDKQTKVKTKEDKKKQAEELNMLFKPVEQKIGKGVDPKSVVCVFFKQGQCGKGAKCKFSHDLNIGRKGEKKNLYSDEREEEENMDDWDEDKLEEVVNKKHGESNKAKPKTAIICKYFLDAVENSKYGWFWQCPNGDKCIYRHCLPPGFVLKKDKKKEDAGDKLTLEDLVETERASLSSKNLTKVTLESFLKWKERKRQEKIAKHKADQDKKKADFRAGRALGLSGKDLFEFDPNLIQGDDDGADDVYELPNETEEDVGEVKEIDFNDLSSLATEVDNTGTKAPDQRIYDVKEKTVNGDTDDKEASRLSEAAGGCDKEKQTEEAIAAAMSAVNDIDGVPIDENLFADEDLQDLEEDLETINLQEG